jgi:hypothetical protein
MIGSFFFYRLPVVQGRKVVMNKAFSRRVPRLKEPALQLLASVTLVFLLAFGADVFLQWAVGLFVAGIVEQDTFFYSAVRQQDAFAQTILASIKLVSFVALGVGFVATLVFFFTPFAGRARSPQALQAGAKPLLKTTLLSLRGIATVTFMFLVVTAIYALLLRIVGNQPPFFLLAALVTTSMYVFILAYGLLDYAKELSGMSRER